MATVRVRKGPDLSAVLVAARHQRGWTQTELAERIGVSRDYVGDMESGCLGMQVTRLLQSLGELGVDVVLKFPTDASIDEERDG
jgi:HTH-type transcriptional regulator / antitoxin HipB